MWDQYQQRQQEEEPQQRNRREHRLEAEPMMVIRAPPAPPVSKASSYSHGVCFGGREHLRGMSPFCVVFSCFLVSSVVSCCIPMGWGLYRSGCCCCEVQSMQLSIRHRSSFGRTAMRRARLTRIKKKFQLEQSCFVCTSPLTISPPTLKHN